MSSTTSDFLDEQVDEAKLDLGDEEEESITPGITHYAMMSMSNKSPSKASHATMKTASAKPTSISKRLQSYLEKSSQRFKNYREVSL